MQIYLHIFMYICSIENSTSHWNRKSVFYSSYRYKNQCLNTPSMYNHRLRISTITILRLRPRVNTLRHLELARFNRI